MKKLTPLIIRLAEHYGLIIYDREQDEFWGKGRWRGFVPRYVIQSIEDDFYWTSDKTEDQFLDDLKEYFMEEGKAELIQ